MGRVVAVLVLAAAVAAAVRSVPNAAAHAAAQAPGGPSPPPPDQVRITYLRDCAVCHGSRGEGTNRGPSLVGVGRAYTDYMVSTGRMPIPEVGSPTVRRPRAYDAAMTRAIVDYVAGFGPGGPDIPNVDPARGDVARGGDVFRLQCASCHAWAAEGGALLRVAAPPLQPASATQIAEAIRVGPAPMPVFGPSAINDHDLDSVVAYIRYLHQPRDRGGQPLWHIGPLAEGAVAWVIGIGLLLLGVKWIGE